MKKSTMLNNMSKAFGASLGLSEREKVATYSLDEADIHLEKVAAIYIHEPTIDNVEIFLRKYILNELTNLSETPDFDIHIDPSSQNTSHSEYIDQASGLVKIRNNSGKDLEIPFMISGGELVPFDVIQVEGQRVPYSVQNVKKVLDGLNHHATTNKLSEDPYLAVEDVSNPATSPGFLGPVLRIRDQAATKGVKGAAVVVASLSTDELLEKTAGMQELTVGDVEKLEQMFVKKAHKEFSEAMEKLAEDVKNTDYGKLKEVRLFEKQKNLPYQSAKDLPHGTTISFPERVDSQIVMTYGTVVDKFRKIGDIKNNEDKIIVTEDGRIKIIKPGINFLCLKTPDRALNFSETKLSSLKQGDSFLAIKDNQIFYPHLVGGIVDRSYGVGNAKSDVTIKFMELTPINQVDDIGDVFGADKDFCVSGNTVNANMIKINFLDRTDFSVSDYSEFIERKSKEVAMDSVKLSNLLSRRSVSSFILNEGRDDYRASKDCVLSCDPNTRVIKVKGVIKDFISKSDDLDKLAFAEDGLEAIDKIAGIKDNKVVIKCKDSNREIYNATVDYVDKSKRMFSKFSKEYKGLDREDVRTFLRFLGYNATEAEVIIRKSHYEKESIFALPENPNIQGLEGAVTKNLAKEKVKNTIKNMVNPQELSSALVGAVASNMLRDALQSSPDKVKSVASSLGKFAEESKLLSAAFEKIACEKESKNALDTAKLMSLSAIFSEKLASTVDGSKVYPTIVETAKDIINSRDILEKRACDLMSLKVHQYTTGDDYINPSYIERAIDNLDTLHKIAFMTTSTKYDMSPIENDILGDLGIIEKEAAVVAMGAIPKVVKATKGVAPKATGGITEGLKGAAGKGLGLGALFGLGSGYQSAVEEAKSANPEALPSDYGEGARKQSLQTAGKMGLIGAGIGAGWQGLKNGAKLMK